MYNIPLKIKCRVCESSQEPLITPCYCRNDSLYVHEACLGNKPDCSKCGLNYIKITSKKKSKFLASVSNILFFSYVIITISIISSLINNSDFNYRFSQLSNFLSNFVGILILCFCNAIITGLLFYTFKRSINYFVVEDSKIKSISRVSCIGV